MAKYINKSVLVAEIERRRNECINSLMTEQVHTLSDILDFLNTLEVKEEVLDKTKLMQKCVRAAYKRGYDMGVLQTTNKVNHNTKEVDLWRKKISNSLTEEGLFTFEDGSQAIITKTN